MADARISELAALATLAADDEFVVVDKSDTAMAASGTTKRITQADAFSAAAIVELGYGERTSGFPSTSILNAWTDIPGCTTTVTVGTRPVVVEANAHLYNDTAGRYTYLVIIEDGVMLATAFWLGQIANHVGTIGRRLRRAPSAGEHTYKLGLAVDATSTGNVFADDSTQHGPCSIQVLQV